MAEEAKSGAPYDVIVWGASGFVGKLICEYMVATYGASGPVKWAMGGRNQAKLEEVRSGLGAGADAIPIVTGDAHDAAALDGIVTQTKVMLTTVGPYAKYGSEMVAACVRHGTDYVDLTGESHWIARMLEAHEADAQKSGARIVPCCGFDSIPSDLGVFFLNEQVKKQTNAPCSTVKMRVKAMKGGASGGTIDSMINMMEEASHDKTVGQVMRDPYCLNPKDKRGSARQPSDNPVEYDEDAHSWIAPFVMAGINTRVVRRSNALLDNAYGDDFVYGEAMLMNGRLGAYGLTAGLGGFMALASMGPTRRFMSKRILPQPGEGPDKEARENGYYNLVFLGKTDAGDEFVARVTGDKDPGYGSTAKMIAESALCLALDVPKENLKGGFWTPASAMGSALIERLERNAGLTFNMEEVSESY